MGSAQGWGGGGAALPALQLGAEGRPSPPLPHREPAHRGGGGIRSHGAGSRQPWGRSLGRQRGRAPPASPPRHLAVPEHPLTCPHALPPATVPGLSSSARGAGAACCAPPRHGAALPGITTPARGGCAGAPGNQVPPAHSAGGERDPMLMGGWGTHAGLSTARKIWSRQPAPAGGVPRTPGRACPPSPHTAAPELSALHEAVEDTVAAVREPVAGHGGHGTDEDGGEDHVALGSQRGEGTNHHTKEHLLQHHHLVLRHVIKKTLLRGICKDSACGGAQLSGQNPPPLPLPAACAPPLTSGRTWGFVLHAVPVPTDVAAGADATVAALCVLTHLLRSRAHRLLGTGALVYVWGGGRVQARLGQRGAGRATPQPMGSTHPGTWLHLASSPCCISCSEPARHPCSRCRLWSSLPWGEEPGLPPEPPPSPASGSPGQGEWSRAGGSRLHGTTPHLRLTSALVGALRVDAELVGSAVRHLRAALIDV